MSYCWTSVEGEHCSGSYYTGADQARTTYPTFDQSLNQSYNLGIRLVRSTPAP